MPPGGERFKIPASRFYSLGSAVLCVSMGKIDLLSTLRVAQLVDNVHKREMTLYP